LTLRTSAPARSAGTLTTRALTGATVLLPGGFFLGGVRFYAGDPGIGVVLVPIGAVLLLIALVLIARGTRNLS
jgi:hypothetical protein